MEHILKEEFLGKQVSVQYNQQEFNGKVIDETKQMIKIRTEKKEVLLPKAQSKIKIKYEGKFLVINGTRLIGRPADRIKKRIKRKW
ncbi:MAG: ribonuclease P protein subunit [Promethearchaeota archaeon]